ncbi:MAG TPA: MraY family glycosyltransferase [Isosphaeraceae bacterium]|jgi:UDP-GlcNAc:undecaprenyl-phosphate GlcNAc-1-phosphate transferase
MSPSSYYLWVFTCAFLGCVFATPRVTMIARWAGAIDRPDQFRRIHKGAVPRMGGLGLAAGLALSLVPLALCGSRHEWDGAGDWWWTLGTVTAAAAIILVVGVIDDLMGMGPRWKLLGQAAAVLVLFHGSIQIRSICILSYTVDLSYPVTLPGPVGGLTLDLPSLAVTLLWFLGCMNVWNLIDGMDGLASGVGLLVTGTLMYIAYAWGNYGAALLAAALAGALAGFLLYNWHPASIFLGDSGSLLIGLLIGVIGVQGSMKTSATVSILFPILAMGLPISDTAMAIFRRWLRNLPLSSADRRHVHHLLIGLGLNPRQAALLLYSVTSGLCGVVLLGVARRSEPLALVLGASGCLAFLLILTSRRDELGTLWSDFRGRLERGRQERFAAKVTWEAIQKVEICDGEDRIWGLVLEASRTLGCAVTMVSCHRRGRVILQRRAEPVGPEDLGGESLSGATASFRLSSGHDLVLSVALHQVPGSPLAADIAFRFLQRLALATAERLERLLDDGRMWDRAAVVGHVPAARDAEVEAEEPRVRGQLARSASSAPGVGLLGPAPAEPGPSFDWWHPGTAPES